MTSSKHEILLMRNNLMSAVVDRYENGENWRFFINLVLVVGGGAIAALGKVPAFPEPHSSWLTCVGLIMVFVGGGLVAIFDRKRTDLTKAAKEAVEKCDEFDGKIGDLETHIRQSELLDERRRFLLSAVEKMHEAVELLPRDTALQIVIEAMLDAGSSNLQGACGFDAGERWTFSIFQRQKETETPNAGWVMRRVAVSWADRAAEKDAEPRFWKKNEGFTGASWQSDKEIIEANLRKPEVAAEYPVPLESISD